MGESNSFDAFIAIIDTEPGQTTVTGMATDIDLVARNLTLSDGTNIYCVEITDETIIQLIDSTDESAEVSSVSLEALINAEIEVTGTIDPETIGLETECLIAESIVLDISPVI